MSALDSGYAGPHPDLRRQVCEMFNEIGLEWPEVRRPGRQATVADVAVVGQRTWQDIETIHPEFTGIDFSIALLTIAVGERNYPWIIAAGRKPDADDWSIAGASGGDEATNDIGGQVGGGWYLCAGCHEGRLGMLRDIASIEIEQANGEIATGRMEDDRCVIACALMNAPRSENHPITIRFLDAARLEINSHSL